MSEREYVVTWDALVRRCRSVDAPAAGERVFGIPRGGSYVAALLNANGCVLEDSPEDAEVFVDDLVDSGRTRERWSARYPGRRWWAPFDKLTEPALRRVWLRFPWEAGEASGEDALVRRLVQYLGDDPDREGLEDTPRRMLGALRELTAGAHVDVPALLARWWPTQHNGLVVVTGIEFVSVCEHHVLPFVGTASVAYLPGERLVGLSKLPRLVHAYAQRLQIQERMTDQVADAIVQYLEPRAAGCIVEATHGCLAHRGVRAGTASMVTHALRGEFLTDAGLRAEFLARARAKS